MSLIRQAVSSIDMEQKAGEMQAQVGVFAKQWIKFIEKLDALGKTLGTVSTHYDELRGYNDYNLGFGAPFPFLHKLKYWISGQYTEYENYRVYKVSIPHQDLLF